MAARIPPLNPLFPSPPDWLLEGAEHLWLPYSQMQTTPMTLPAVKTEGVRITLADGRELIDGISSWWTAAHGYNHPRIREATAAAAAPATAKKALRATDAYLMTSSLWAGGCTSILDCWASNYQE